MAASEDQSTLKREMVAAQVLIQLSDEDNSNGNNNGKRKGHEVEQEVEQVMSREAKLAKLAKLHAELFGIDEDFENNNDNNVVVSRPMKKKPRKYRSLAQIYRTTSPVPPLSSDLFY